MLIRKGRYCIYNNKEYKLFNIDDIHVRLLSDNPNDLKKGFSTKQTDDFSKKYGFICKKTILKSEIAEVYELNTRYFYKKEEFQVIGNRNGTDLLTLSTKFIDSGCIDRESIIKHYVDMGFHQGQIEKTGCWYEKEVSINDPDLEFIEVRVSIDGY